MSVIELRPRKDGDAQAAERTSMGGAILRALDFRQMVRTPYGIAPLLVLVLANFFIVIAPEVFTIAGPNVAQDLGLDIATVGGIAALAGTVLLVAALGVGWIADRVRRVPLFAAGLAIYGLFGIFQSRASSTGTFGASQVAIATGRDVSTVPVQSLLADYYPVESRGRVFGLVTAAGLVTTILAPVLVGYVVYRYGWRTATLATTLPMIPIAVIAFLFLKEPKRGYFERLATGMAPGDAEREQKPVSFAEGWRTVWSVRTIRRLFVADAVSALANTPVNAFLIFVLADIYGLNAAQRGLFLVPSSIAGVVAAFLGGAVLDVLGRRSPSSILRVIGAVGLVGVGITLVQSTFPPLPVFVAALVVGHFVGVIITPASSAIYSLVMPPVARSQGFVILTFASVAGSLGLGLGFAKIAQLYGFGPMFLATIPFQLLAIVIRISAADFFEGDRRNAQLAAAAAVRARTLAEQGRTRLLAVSGVNVFYDTNQVLFGVDFEVEAGEIVALLGTNGAGKSTLLRAISGTQEAGDGAILFDGEDITHRPPHEIAALGIVHMPGGRGVFPGLSVEENLRLGTWLIPPREVPERLRDAYAEFPVLERRRGALAGSLSGGEQQMLALAQAFMARPRLLMIDELSLGLSPAVVGELLEKVRAINARGTTVIVVEQSVNVALTLAGRAVFMEKGEVRFSGPTADLLARPDILRAVYVKGTGTINAPGERSHRVAAVDARPLLVASGIFKRFGGVTALDGVDLELGEGRILGLVGPNGSGKTTLFDIISGYQRADAGKVILDGTDVTAMGPEARARLHMVRRFQDARLFPSLTVTETLLVALDQRLESRNLLYAAAGVPQVRRAERRARVRAERLIELLELGPYRDKFVRELSTGLRRIVDIAWVLATQPKVLLLDEPSSGVAQSEAEGFGPLLRRVRHETGCSILIVEHDIPLVTAVADELVAMASGRVLARGTAKAVLEDDRVIEAFLGTSEAAVRRSGVLV